MFDNDEPQDDFNAACFEIAALAVALRASGTLPANTRAQLARIQDRALYLHRFAQEAERDYLDHLDGLDDE